MCIYIYIYMYTSILSYYSLLRYNCIVCVHIYIYNYMAVFLVKTPEVSIKSGS